MCLWRKVEPAGVENIMPLRVLVGVVHALVQVSWALVIATMVHLKGLHGSVLAEQAVLLQGGQIIVLGLGRFRLQIAVVVRIFAGLVSYRSSVLDVDLDIPLSGKRLVIIAMALPPAD